MTIIQATLLGFLQGLTEFLPVSSDGHLTLLETFFQFKASEMLFFDVLLHLATLVAVCIFYRERIIELILCCFSFVTFRKKPSFSDPDFRLILAILLCTVITGGFGVAFKDTFEAMRDHLPLVGGCFIFSGIVLFLTRFRSKQEPTGETYPPNIWIFTIIIGLAQTLAIAPGISRSGSTVAAALLLGAPKVKSVEFSFLVSIPAILGAAVLELRHAKFDIGVAPAVTGFIVALISGFIFLNFLVWIVSKGKFHRFAYYLLPLGLFVLIYSLW